MREVVPGAGRGCGRIRRSSGNKRCQNRGLWHEPEESGWLIAASSDGQVLQPSMQKTWYQEQSGCQVKHKIQCTNANDQRAVE